MLNVQVYKPNSKAADFTLIHGDPKAFTKALKKELGGELGTKANEALKPIEDALVGMADGTLPASLVQMQLGERRLRLKNKMH